MLVVGYRQSAREGLRFLLQNWWREKQFVEVDETNFKLCNETAVAFVMTRQMRFPTGFDVTGDAFAVCAADGAGVAGSRRCERVRVS